MPHARPRNHAFTLIELMVVISIVALLIALLMPALASAREGAQLALCMGNQRQMSNAMFTYAEASKGYAPYMNAGSGEWSGKIDKITNLTGTIYLPNNSPPRMTTAAADTFVERNVWHCPTVGLSASTMDGNNGRQYNLPTYAFNLYVGYDALGGNLRLTHLDRYAQPDRVPWLMDGFVTTNTTLSQFTSGILGAAAKPLAMYQYVKQAPATYTQPPSYGGAPHYNKSDPLFYNYCNNPGTYQYKRDAIGTYAFIDLHVSALGVDDAKNKRTNKEILFSYKNFTPSISLPGLLTDPNWWEMGP